MENERVVLLSADEVFRTVGVRRTKIYEMIRDGVFPKPRKIGAVSRWRSDEVQDFIDNLPSAA